MSALLATTSIADDLVAGCHILDGERLTDAFGHLSARLAGGDVVITPRVGPGLVTSAGALLRLTAAGDVVDGDERLVPGETALHLGILEARPDVGAVVRFHGASCFAWSTLARPLPAASGLTLMLGGEVPVHDVAVTVTTLEQARALAGTLGAGSAVLLRGFGAVTTGATVAEAVVRATFLERAASIVLQASTVGEPVTYADDQIAAFSARTAVIAEQLERAWSYLAARHGQEAS